MVIYTRSVGSVLFATRSDLPVYVSQFFTPFYVLRCTFGTVLRTLGYVYVYHIHVYSTRFTLRSLRLRFAVVTGYVPFGFVFPLLIPHYSSLLLRFVATLYHHPTTLWFYTRILRRFYTLPVWLLVTQLPHTVGYIPVGYAFGYAYVTGYAGSPTFTHVYCLYDFTVTLPPHTHTFYTFGSTHTFCPTTHTFTFGWLVYRLVDVHVPTQFHSPLVYVVFTAFPF